MRITIIYILALFTFLSNIKAQLPKAASITDSATNKTFMVVQIESEFPGGQQGWIEYLQKNLNTKLGNKYINIPKGEKSARQTVKMSFLVTKDGDITDIEVTNKDSIHPKLAEEAIRVIKNGPKWIPAQQGSVVKTPNLTSEEQEQAIFKMGLRKVSSRKKQAITWQADKD